MIFLAYLMLSLLFFSFSSFFCLNPCLLIFWRYPEPRSHKPISVAPRLIRKLAGPRR